MVMVWPLDDKARYSYATNDQPKAKDILTRAGIGPVNRPPIEFKWGHFECGVQILECSI